MLLSTLAGVNWMQYVVLPESGFTAFWTLSISWSGQYSCANSLNICIQTFCVIGHWKDCWIRTFHTIWHWTDHRIQISVCYWTPDRSQDRLLDIVDKLNCQLQWPGQIGFITVSLYVLLTAYHLTVIIIFNC